MIVLLSHLTLSCPFSLFERLIKEVVVQRLPTNHQHSGCPQSHRSIHHRRQRVVRTNSNDFKDVSTCLMSVISIGCWWRKSIIVCAHHNMFEPCHSTTKIMIVYIFYFHYLSTFLIGDKWKSITTLLVFHTQKWSEESRSCKIHLNNTSHGFTSAREQTNCSFKRKYFVCLSRIAGTNKWTRTTTLPLDKVIERKKALVQTFLMFEPWWELSSTTENRH